MTKERVLVVEDELIAAMDIQRTLENLGFEVPEVVASGEEAIEKITENQPDLVLMDIALKGELDGIDAAEQIRNQCEVPIVYLTAHADDITLHRAKTTIPSGYLIKPYQERELYSTIELALYNHKAKRELKASEEKFRTLIEGANDGIAIIQDTIIKFANPRFADMCGYERSELIDKPFPNYLPTEELLKVIEYDKQRIAGDSGSTMLTTQLRHKNGDVKPVELNISPIVYEGKSYDMIIIRDISER